MNDLSYSAHISNGKSAVTTKGKLVAVEKHNLRKYQPSLHKEENIYVLIGSTHLVEDVKKIYQEAFDEAVKNYNAKQKRSDRKIQDYFDHVSNLDQDMAVELIVQFGDKDYWDEVKKSCEGDEVDWEIAKGNIRCVFRGYLEALQEEIPDYRIANAVVHYDEASPHMHVIGVPVARGYQKGMETQVSKRKVFTKEVLEQRLQGSIRRRSEELLIDWLGRDLKEKQKGRNEDLTVLEYKCQQEKTRMDQLRGEIEEKQDWVEQLQKARAVEEVYVEHLQCKREWEEGQVEQLQNERQEAEMYVQRLRSERRELEEEVEEVKEEIRGWYKKMEEVKDFCQRASNLLQKLSQQGENLRVELYRVIGIKNKYATDLLDDYITTLRNVLSPLMRLTENFGNFLGYAAEKTEEIEKEQEYSRYQGGGRSR